MRHFFLRAILAGSLGMIATATVGRLIAFAGFALRAASDHLGAFSRTVDVAAVATGADQHLSLAACAEIEARRCIGLLGFATET